MDAAGPVAGADVRPVWGRGAAVRPRRRCALERITITDDGAEAPIGAAAGHYLMVLENGSASEVDATFVKLPEGQTLATLDEGAGNRQPDWLYETEIAGGTVAPAGGVGTAVVDLTAGEWFFDVSRQSEDDGEASPETEGAGGEQLLMLIVTGDAGSPVAAEEPAGRSPS